jgi:type I restriction enzyme S subunit
MSNLPEGWVRTTLGEVTTIVSGSTPKTGVPGYWGGDIVWITPDDLSKNRGKTVASGGRSITQAGYDSCSATLMPPGSVLYSSRAPIGYAAIATTSVCTNQGFKSFVPSEAVTSDYLYWFLVHATPAIRELGSGTTFPELSKKSAAGFEIALPPLPEQRRIVAAIEEQISRLDTANAVMSTAGRRLDTLLRVLVRRAMEGDWPQVRLGDVTESQIYGTSAKASADPTGVPVLRMGNIQAGRVDLTNLKYLPRTHPDVQKLALSPGDLLFNRTNSPELVGKTAVFRDGPQPTMFASYLIRVRLSDKCHPEWASQVINGPIGRAYIASVRTQQVGQANVNGKKLAAMLIPLPPLGEQHRILASIGSRTTAITSIRTGVAQAAHRSASLRRAVLGRAFHGDLVPRDPSDEPASTVLARIRAERPPTLARARRRTAAT